MPLSAADGRGSCIPRGRGATTEPWRTLADVLAARTRAGDPALYERLDGTWVRCLACGHACPIPDGAAGVCKVRFNRGGTLMVPWGYVAGAQSDPIEKKPFFHVEPGSLAFSFGMLGCDLHCAYCQNWVTLAGAARPGSRQRASTDVEPRDARARRPSARAPARSSAPTTSRSSRREWAVEVFRLARAAGLLTGFVSNGNGTPQVLEFLGAWIDLFKVDLKGFDDRSTASWRAARARARDDPRPARAGIWIEMVTLLVPGLNDSDDELAR